VKLPTDEFTKEYSQTVNAQIFGERLKRQLAKIPESKMENLMKNFEVNVRFGRFYLTDKRYIFKTDFY
jgi:hypothetical protein